MGVPTHDGVDAGDAAGHFEVYVHAVVAQHHDHLRSFGPGFIHHGLHVFFLNAKGPVGHHVAWVGDGGIGECLTNDGAGHAVHFFNDIRLENWISKVLCLDILSKKIYFACKIFFNNFLDAFHAQCEFPMTCHDLDAQQFACIYHVLAIGP